MTNIYLTRHGQTEWNLEGRFQGRLDSPLTEDGLKQARALSDRLINMNIDVIYTSPIKRAFKTAEILKGNKKIEIKILDELKEMGFGDFEGLTNEEAKKSLKNWDLGLIMAGDTDLRAPNGENLLELRNRVAPAMDRIISENRGKDVLVVTHGMTLKAIMHYFKDYTSENSVMGQATLTKVIVDDNNEFNIEYKNDGSHFCERISSVV